MPGAEWLPGARLNFAEHVLRARDADAVAIRHASELRPLAELTRGELPGRGGADRRGPAGARRGAGRPRRRLSAEHPRGGRGVPRVRLDRRDLVELLAGLRRPERDRPLRADRAARPAGGRRLPLRGQGLRPPRCRAGAGRRAADGRAHGAARLPRSRAAARGPAGADPLAGPARRRRRGDARVRAGAVRSSAVGAVQLGHDGAAEGDRARPRGRSCSRP